ncbi:uncharacterized protein EDB91DRAFT_1048366, partial [Suillus paluster]|uniref:uncharacterized protein n=1 Tax=Suillus paluster TaxID=48578 RepID=UPI001B869FF5
ALVVTHHLQLQGAFGSINRLKLPIQTSDDIDIENTTYNGWLSEHFISSVIAFSVEGAFFCLSPMICTQLLLYKGVVIAARTNAPGSWHNSHLTSHIYTQLLLNTPPDYYIVADTVFPHGTTSVDGQHLCTSETWPSFAWLICLR